VSIIKLTAEGMMSVVSGNAKMRIDAHALPPHPIASFAKRKKLLTHLQNTGTCFMESAVNGQSYVPLQCMRALA
jgi:hypothetical protein